MSGSDNYYIYGIHAIQAVLARTPERVLNVAIVQDKHDARIDTLLQEIKHHGIALQRVPEKQLNKQLGDVNHQGVMALVRPPHIGNEQDLLHDLTQKTAPLLLILDGVQDPHNLGACLRSADAAGADGVVVPRDRACSLTATVSKVASGAAEVLPFYQVTNLARTLRALQDSGVHCVGLAGEATTSLYDCDLNGPVALVLGTEGSGLRRLTRETCDVLAKLPMHGSVESLNVSVTAGIALYEAVRQRTQGR
ncbi:MAG: 23S rRNA (guanosine(2251)-2'-O)-methyltransferase RlmB [Gammaproteobacteria bacterium]|nr:23S rRNA (guanosine(2251)-2'-O)-methyltransferase RlmB [Gammaproteobacteria bacterium]